MSKFHQIQNSFSYGEFNGKMDGRSDVEQYQHAASLIENMFTMYQGGLEKRPGSQYVADITGSGAKLNIRTIPFVFSETEVYTVVIRATDSTACTAVIAPDGTAAVITNTGTDPFPLKTSVGTATHNTQFAQSGDVMWLVNPLYKPCKLKRTGSNTFDCEEYDTLGGGLATKYGVTRFPFRFRSPGITATTLTINTATAGEGRTLTASADLFDSGHIGAYFRCSNGTDEGVCIVTGVTNATSATVTVLVAFGDTSASSDWSESAWSDYRGWPRSICFHEERLIMGGNSSQPDTFWATKTSNYDHFMAERLLQDKGATDDSGLNYFGASILYTHPFDRPVGAGKVNVIQWMASDIALLIGTLGEEYSVKAIEGVFTNANLQSHLQSSHGSEHIQAAIGNGKIFYVQSGGQVLREMFYDFNTNKYESLNANLYNDTISKHGFEDLSLYTRSFASAKIRQIEYHSGRGVVWCVTNQNALVSYTSNQDGSVRSWTRHKFSGEVADFFKNSGQVFSVCVLPSSTNSQDDLFLAMTRDINGTPKNYLERIRGSFEQDTLSMESTSTEDYPIFVDSAAITDNRQFFLGVGGDVSVAGDTISITAHGYSNNDQLVFVMLNGEVGGLTSGDTYYVVNKNDDDFQLSLTSGGAAIDFTGSGTFLDLGYVYSAGQTSFSGFDHLEGESLYVLADGKRIEKNLTVSSGSITVSEGSYLVIAGLPYAPIVNTLRLEAGPEGQTAQGTIMDINRAVIRFYKSYGCKVGPRSDLLDDTLNFNPLDYESGDVLTAKSGDISVDILGGAEEEKRLYITQDSPTPLTIISLILKGQAHAR